MGEPGPKGEMTESKKGGVKAASLRDGQVHVIGDREASQMYGKKRGRGNVLLYAQR